MQKVHFRLTSVAQKRCCLSSLFTRNSVPLLAMEYFFRATEEGNYVAYNRDIYSKEIALYEECVILQM